jgi:hypothetical protein
MNNCGQYKATNFTIFVVSSRLLKKKFAACSDITIRMLRINKYTCHTGISYS